MVALPLSLCRTLLMHRHTNYPRDPRLQIICRVDGIR